MFKGPNDAPSVKFQETVTFDPALLDENDKMMYGYLNRLYTAINGTSMNPEEVKTALDALVMFNKQGKINYLDNLLHPERCKGCKIPSSIPVPSAAFQMHNTITLGTNSLGNCALIFNPFFLYDKDSKLNYITKESAIVQELYKTTMWYNNDDTLTGSDNNDNWRPVNIQQGIPSVYGSYRVVSASIVVKYIGRMDIASGVVGGAIVFDDDNTLGVDFGSIVMRNPNLSKYGNFDLAQDSFYFKENLAIEGVREIYFPLDNSYEEYVNTFLNTSSIPEREVQDPTTWIIGKKEDFKSGFNFFFYSQGAPANSACFKVDIFVNYECLPDARFLNYMPISAPAPAISNVEKSEYIKYAQQTPIGTSKPNEFIPTKTENFWEKAVKKFGKSMPGIINVAKSGLLNSIPYLKPALTIANSMLNMNSMDIDS